MSTPHLPIHDSKMSAAARCRMILLATLLGWTTCTYADIRIPGPEDPLPEEPRPPPPPPCVPAATGTMTANIVRDVRPGFPAVIDISWSTSTTRSCPNRFPEFHLVDSARQPWPVDPRGTRRFHLDRLGAHTFRLQQDTYGAGPPRPVASINVPVTQSFAVISEGNAVTPDDIANFDRLWMHDALVGGTLSGFDYYLGRAQLGIGWDVGERLEAMVHMFELTREPRYLAHMHKVIEIALKYRDDRRPDAPLDAFRRDRSTPMPSWGTSIAASGFYWTASLDLDLSGAMLYPIAAFTRIVAEDPQLWGARIDPGSPVTYGQKALEYANAVLDSVEATAPYWQSGFDNNGREHRYTRSLPILREMLTESRCREASQTAGNPDAYNRCRDYANFAGLPHPHNLTHTQTMTAIELWRTLSTPFYQQSSEYRSSSAQTRQLIINNVRGGQWFFENDLLVPAPWVPTRYIWNYMVDSPRPHIEDVTHAAVSMRYLGMLRENQHLLNLHDLVTDDLLRRFANTLLLNASTSERFAHDVRGREATADEALARDRVCAGWLELSRVDSRVYERCAAITLRIVGGQQPNVHAVNHAALLRTKQYRQ